MKKIYIRKIRKKKQAKYLKKRRRQVFLKQK